MTTRGLKILENALINRAGVLARSLSARNRIAVEPASDGLDATMLAAGRESSARNLSQEFFQLRQVEAARRRMRDGAYGFCLRCEDEIAVKRLHAIPWAAYCLSCQARSEEDGDIRSNPARAV